MTYPVWDIVRFIVGAGEAQEDGDSITNMKLQKLLYYFQGFHLAVFNDILFEERIEAWEHGPVVPKVWKKLRVFGRDPIRMNPNAPEPCEFNDRHLALMDDVYRTYGQFAAWKLRRMTHAEPPWKTAYRRGQETTNNEITQDSMKRFFVTRLRSNGA